MEKSNNFDPVWWKNLKMLTLFDGKKIDLVWWKHLKMSTMFDGKFKKFDLVSIKHGYFPETKRFDGDVDSSVPCFVELSGISDPVWWKYEKNRTLFDGEMKKIGPCLMEKLNIIDPVWWKKSWKRTLFGPSIVYSRALEFHPRGDP